MEINELLPIGSVVLLKGGIKKIMIIGLLHSITNEEKTVSYDYVGVLYPEGYLTIDTMVLFNHEQINDVIFEGYRNPEQINFMKLVKQYTEDFNNVETEDA